MWLTVVAMFGLLGLAIYLFGPAAAAVVGVLILISAVWVGVRG